MGRPVIDLTNQKFGKLTVIRLNPERAKSGFARWDCNCDCGSENFTAVSGDLKSGHVKSCGCLHTDNKVDITNKEFGRWRAMEYVKSDNRNNALWLCVCSCGSEKLVSATLLRQGRSKSCGCLGKEVSSGLLKTHGMTDTPEFKSWSSAKGRCLNKNNQAYHAYGGAGIGMHEKWIDNFQDFLEHIGPMPKDGIRYTIDRIDNSTGYLPGNVRWATHKEQMNNRSCNVYHEIDGCRLTTAQLAEEYGIFPSVLNRRAKILPIEEAVKPIKLSPKSKYRHNDQTLMLEEWIQIFNLDYYVVCRRLFLGWKFKEAIQSIEEMKLSYNGAVESLGDWCVLYSLDIDVVGLKILRGSELKEIIEAA